MCDVLVDVLALWCGVLAHEVLFHVFGVDCMVSPVAKVLRRLVRERVVVPALFCVLWRYFTCFWGYLCVLCIPDVCISLCPPSLCLG